MSDFDSLSSVSSDKELQDFLMVEKQKAQVNAQIHEFNDICWEKCIGKPGSKLDSSTETCLSNCVDRFIDTSLLVTQRFAQLLQKRSGAL
ncbi:PREDICTED: mitochondrial import inner membrane translocase subunit Tim8 [Bactrocera latifrons]|uniref:Mitochondrial import inner membrane translocase subunit n=1 Tax=Bactrocera dorsalis TaxID=27457 RepID=A0A6I9VG11_BACDO|nr:mitochondrial import inner membrane translocase subunit Tim8 [Bactrocera dorsalis]XP_018792830.1 PREDICTED: mitochondrial import inner membrane translocase subunit Tim8 [Bactrocera latifrons]